MEKRKYSLSWFKKEIVHNKRSDYLFLFLYVLIVYFPIALFIFSLKNDATTINLPVKLFFSAFLKDGDIPLWNPFLKSGFPVYADPGFSFWNPITWLFGIVGYNAYTFHSETILYIFIGSIGFYKLSGYYGLDRITCLLAGCLYCTSGFISGSLEFTNYLTAGAFFPFCIKYLDAIVSRNRYADIWYLAISGYFLLNSGHPAIPAGSFYFFIVFLAVVFFRESITLTDKRFYRTAGRILLSVLLLFLLSLPMLYSLTEVMPFFNRKAEIPSTSDISDNLWEGFPYILTSLFNPLFQFAETPIVKGTLYRISYVTMTGLLLVICFFRSNCRNKYFRMYFLLAVLSIIFILPGDISKLLRAVLPGFRYIKHFFPFRLFLDSMIIMLIAFGFQYQRKKTGIRIQSVLNRVNIQKWIVILFTVVSILLCTYSLLNQYIHTADSIQKTTFFFNLPNSLLTAYIITSTIILILFLIKRYYTVSLFFVILTETLLFTWIVTPVTGFSKTRVAGLNNMIHSVKRNKGIPELVPLNSFTGIPGESSKRLGNWSFYENIVVADTSFNYPSYLKNNLSDHSGTYAEMQNKPFVFLNNSGNSLSIRYFSADEITLNLTIDSEDTLVLFQNNYPGWVMKSGDRYVQPVANRDYCSFPIQGKGRYEVSLHFQKPVLKYLLCISMFAALFSYLLIFTLKRENKYF